MMDRRFCPVHLYYSLGHGSLGEKAGAPVYRATLGNTQVASAQQQSQAKNSNLLQNRSKRSHFIHDTYHLRYLPLPNKMTVIE
jgi:hypothetical protein